LQQNMLQTFSVLLSNFALKNIKGVQDR